jgi:hypothetical protein
MLGHDNPPPPPFWTSVRWPRGELAVVLVVAVAVGVMVSLAHREPLYGRLLYGSVVTAGLVAIGGGAWAAACILRAWVARPARTRLGRWLRTAVQFLLLGPDPPRR